MWIEATEAMLKSRIFLESNRVGVLGVKKIYKVFTITALGDDCYRLGSFNTRENAEAALDGLMVHLVNGDPYYKITDDRKDENG